MHTSILLYKNLRNKNIVGVGLFMIGIGVIPNNSILLTNSGGHISQLFCLSGSNRTTVGNWISPEGRILDAVQNDPFDIIFGSGNIPGQLVVETPLSNPPLTTTHEGVYTCVMPNEDGEIEYLRIGIYLNASESIENACLSVPLNNCYID